MITLKGASAIYEGLSTDSKPTSGIDVNTLFHELNTNKWYYFKSDSTWAEVPNTGGGGSGFTPTDEQLAAMNSGITAEDVTQIGINENNILSKIGASDYATQNTGGTVRVWTTTDGTDTILHIANEAPTP